MKKLVILFLLSLSINSKAQDLNSKDNKYLGYIYQQKEYQLNDPKGDILLLWSANQIPHYILKNLEGKKEETLSLRKEKVEELLAKYPQFRPTEETKNIIVENYLTCNPNHLEIELEGHVAPFQVKNLVNMLKEVITEEYQNNGIKPQYGTIHTWSPELKNESNKKFVFFNKMSKLLVALSRGGTSYYMVTGKEESLKDYVITRPENSVTLEEIFRASYRINQGDVYLTLLTIENILSRYWLVPERSKRLITTKLKDITNYYYKTDKFGSWYHLFGIMLYGYAEGGLKAKLVGNIETIGSHILGKFADEKQEDFINSRGGVIGGHLRRFVKNNEFESFQMDKKYTEENFYLNLREDFSKRLEKYLSK